MRSINSDSVGFWPRDRITLKAYICKRNSYCWNNVSETEFKAHIPFVQQKKDYYQNYIDVLQDWFPKIVWNTNSMQVILIAAKHWKSSCSVWIVTFIFLYILWKLLSVNVTIVVVIKLLERFIKAFEFFIREPVQNVLNIEELRQWGKCHHKY